MDESGEKEVKLQMLLLSLKDLLSEYGDRSGCGEVGRTIVSGYDTKLLQDVVETALTNFAKTKEEEAVVASRKTSKPLLPMDESGGEKGMKLLSLEDLRIRYGVPGSGSGEDWKIIVWGYDTRFLQDVVETALRNYFSNCGRITNVYVPVNYGSDADTEELHDISYIYFDGEGAVDNALLLNGTDVYVGGWTVYIKPYPFRPNLKPMVWLNVEGFDTSLLSKIEIKRELIQLFSSCGEVDEYDVHVFKSGSAELIVKGEDAAEKVPKLNGSSFMGQQHKLVLRNVCYGQIQTEFPRGYAFHVVRPRYVVPRCGPSKKKGSSCLSPLMKTSKQLLPMDESGEKEMKLSWPKESDDRGYAVPGCGEVGRITVRGYDTKLPQDVVETSLRNHFSSCGRITDVCVTINTFNAEKLDAISYIYFVGEGAVDKALDLNGTDVGGWTVNIKADPFCSDAKRIIQLNVEGFDTSLSKIEIKDVLIEHFSSCGEVSVVYVSKSGSAQLIVEGEDAAEKVPKLNGSIMGHHKLVLRNVRYRHIRTVHERSKHIFC